MEITQHKRSDLIGRPGTNGSRVVSHVTPGHEWELVFVMVAQIV